MPRDVSVLLDVEVALRYLSRPENHRETDSEHVAVMLAESALNRLQEYLHKQQSES